MSQPERDAKMELQIAKEYYVQRELKRLMRDMRSGKLRLSKNER